VILATVVTLGTLVVVPVVLVVVFSRVFFVVLAMVRVWVRVVWVVRMVDRRLLQRPSKRTTEEIGNFKGLFLDAVPESVTASARAVLSSSVFPC
jgi:hypothetical protein